jgi:hypothetical protein
MPTVETHTTRHQRNLDRDRHLDRALISVEISISAEHSLFRGGNAVRIRPFPFPDESATQ